MDSLAGSVSIAVVHKDEIVYTYAYGQANPVEGIPADTQTIYAVWLDDKTLYRHRADAAGGTGPGGPGCLAG